MGAFSIRFASRQQTNAWYAALDLETRALRALGDGDVDAYHELAKQARSAGTTYAQHGRWHS